MYRLKNTVREYAWGSETALSELLKRPASGRPEAELWIGAHPDAPSVVLREDSRGPEALDSVIEDDAEGMLGSASDQFGTLPFLMKILCAAQPLSIQVHPTREQAQAGFERENEAGVPQDAANRNYKDANHKPEMIFALTRFEALCGFAPRRETAHLLEAWAKFLETQQELSMDTTTLPVISATSTVPEPVNGDRAVDQARALAGLLLDSESEEDALRDTFTLILKGGSGVRSLAATAPLLASAGDHVPDRLRELTEIAKIHPGDPGLVVSLMLNRITLMPGETIYLPAGNVHAYLRGTGVEVMASSDNVLRGGLTAKHIDLRELVSTVTFQESQVPHVEAHLTDLGQELYQPPFEEFQLQRIELSPTETPSGGDVVLAQSGPAVVLVTRGSLRLESPTSTLELHVGDSAFIPASESPVVVRSAGPAGGTAFATTVSEAATGL
ncbi:mannose-6-phosphate isomerase, class I [Neomicrococcus aestuarii]|uniref:mannose-6-phosphate isomerase n=1 Tax=Neomicrococcus aestuarii TaxID=556325 RepID=A0A1L2ZMZ5_9MICC|nr:mannose-6-phosphate isomerase, class I [Neomicrococcus aestuarii]APF40509.1 mannose-6-phosphate isomerase, class I [Neomicrococcus aestuarii]